MALTKSDVSALYVAIFNRASEGEGNTYWQTAGTAAEVADAMLDTAPAKEYFGSALNNDEDFIAHIYLNTLGKTTEQDPEGIAYWVGELATQTRGEVIARLIESALDPVHEGSDAQKLFKNMVAVSDYAAETIEDAPEDLSVLRFDEGLKGITADDASVEAGKTKVDQILNPVDPVVAALEEVQAARKALDDFLFEVAQTDEPGDEPAATRFDLENALKNAEAFLEGNDYAANAGFKVTDSAAVQAAKLDAAKTIAAEEVAAEQEKVDEAKAEAAKKPGLLAALNDVQARKAALAAAENAEVAAQAALNAANASYETLYQDEPVVADQDGKLIVNPEIKDAQQIAEATKVLAAQVAMAQADAAVTAAEAALEKANLVVVFADIEKGDKDELFDAVTGNDPLSDKGNATVGRGDSLSYDQYQAALAAAEAKLAAAEEAENTEDAAEAQKLIDNLEAAFDGVAQSTTETADKLKDAEQELKDAKEAEKELLEAIEAREEAQAVLDQLAALEKALEEAEKALEDTGFEVIHLDEVAVAGTAGDDVFVLHGEDSTIHGFNVQGSDKLYVGGDFKLVTLGADQKIADRLGDVDQMEIFIKQVDGNSVLYVEKQAFAGNATNTDDIVTITLNGVNVDDLVLEDGFLAIA